MWRYYLPLAGLVVLVMLFWHGLQRDPSLVTSPLIGKPAPAFALPDVLDPSRVVSNANYRGRVYVLNVWGTWCGGCRDEHEALLEIARTKVVPLIGFNWKDDRALAQRWLSELGDPYAETAFDPEGRVAIDWGVYGAPETFLVGPDGRVLHKHVAALTLEIWKRDFLPKIAAAAAAVQAPSAASRP
jgi:cytochrome c biogenesis protein CcmG/thiol:disulfide interchange protein DsbE